MSYIEQSLSTDERIREVFKLHWFAWAPVVVWVLLAPLTLGLTLLLAIYHALKIRSMEFGVTSKRVIFKHGIISRKTQELKVSAVETVEIAQGIIGRIFGYGTVKLTGRGMSDLVFKGVDDPMSVKRRIEDVAG